MNEWVNLRNRTRSQTRLAVQSGQLTKDPCERCGNEQVEAHHEDYYKPLMVNWLCESCHREHHRSHPYDPGDAAEATRLKDEARKVPVTQEDYSVNEAAELLAFVPAYVYALLKQSKIQGMRIGNGRWRIPGQEILRIRGDSGRPRRTPPPPEAT